VCAQTAIFFNKPVSKKCGDYTVLIHLCLESSLVSPKRVQNTGCAVLCGFFHQQKTVPANRKKGFYTSRLQKNEKTGGIFYLAAQNFKQFQEIKNLSLII
jgi:hypothetical protein